MKFVYRDGSIVNFQFVRASFLQSYYVFNIAEGKTSLFSLRKVPFCKNLVDVNTRRNQYYNIIETLKKNLGIYYMKNAFLSMKHSHP